VLFLWATVPMLPHALEVMAASGFSYKSSFVWVKPRAGTGYWNRNQHELLLVGTKGNVPAPAAGTQWSSVIEAPTGRHSEKPILKDRRVLLGGKFTLPFSAGTAVATDEIIERVAPAKCAVAQHRDAAATTVDAIQHC
jgi:hypothetical protein